VTVKIWIALTLTNIHMPVEPEQPTPKGQPEQQPEQQEEAPNVEQMLQAITETSEIPIQDKLDIALDWILDLVDSDQKAIQTLIQLISTKEEAKQMFSSILQNIDTTTLLEQGGQPQEGQPQQGQPQESQPPQPQG